MEQNAPTRVHCFFEQSGTFKNEFIKLGIPAEDYDIQNHFGQTDHVIDLFAQIEAAYDGKASVFDTIKPSDLIMAFFPCIYFCGFSQLAQTYSFLNYKCLTVHEKTQAIIKRQEDRTYFLGLLTKLFCIVYERDLRMVVENPATGNFLTLKQNFVEPCTFIDRDRTTRGDVFKKPTAYWFVNIKPHTHTHTHTHTPKSKIRKITKAASAERAGLCSEARSMISQDYARNFICDFILGKRQAFTDLELFND